MIKNFDDLTFTDDFMFCIILENNEKLTRELVELILGKKISKIENLKSQQVIKDFSNAKGVRFDVYFEDDENTAYDVEMQAYQDMCIAKRSHYYHSLIAVDNLNKGASYKSLKDSYVIFICTYDPLGDGLPVYTVHSRPDEMLEHVVEDGVTTVYLNCESRSPDISPELQAFFKYVTENLPSEGLTNSIESDLVLAKEQKEWRQYYMTLYEIKERERAEGRAEGIVEAIDAIVQKLGLSLEQACKTVGVTVEEYNQAKQAIQLQ